jgi:hypothetical protein
MSVSFNSKFFLTIALKKLKNNLLQSRCSLCMEPLAITQNLFCHSCEKDLPYINKACVRCCEPLPYRGTCPSCQKQPPYFRQCIALCDYQYPISTALKNIKQAAHAPETKKLSSLLVKHLKRAYRAQTLPSMVIPVPVHPLRIYIGALIKVHLLLIIFARSSPELIYIRIFVIVRNWVSHKNLKIALSA